MRCVGRPLFNFASMPPARAVTDQQQLVFNQNDAFDGRRGWSFTDMIGEEFPEHVVQRRRAFAAAAAD